MINAVAQLSGGLDSTTMLAIAKSEGFSPYALSFRYGQRHQAELESARRVASAMDVVEHVIADIDLRRFGVSALTRDIDVSKGRQKLRSHVPLIELSRVDIIRRDADLWIDDSLTSSCCRPADDGAPCGSCGPCLLREEGFAEAGPSDPRVARFAGSSRD